MLAQGAKLDALGTQIVQHGDEVTQAAAEPVEFPDNEGIAWAERFEATDEGRALGGRAREALVLENRFASGFLQRRKLQSGVLVVGADPCIAIFHTLCFATGICNM
jgi:hypothetical protein